MPANFTQSFQDAFGSAAQFGTFLALCETSPLLKFFIQNFGGTVDVARDGTQQNNPAPGAGTQSNAILVSVDPKWLPFDAKGQPQSTALSYALLATALAHEFGHQELPDGRSTSIFNTASVSDAILAGEKAEGAAFTAEYVVAQQLVDFGGANEIIKNGGLLGGSTGLATITYSDTHNTSGDSGLLFAVNQTNTSLDLIGSATSLSSLSPFFGDATMAGGQYYSGLHPSTDQPSAPVAPGGPDLSLTYQQFWVGQWILALSYNFDSEDHGQSGNVDWRNTNSTNFSYNNLTGAITGIDIPLLKGTAVLPYTTTSGPKAHITTAPGETFSFNATAPYTGTASPTLYSATLAVQGSASIYGGAGNDVFYGRPGTDDFVVASTSGVSTVETIFDTAGDGTGQLILNGQIIAPTKLTSSSPKHWSDGTHTYQFIPWSQIPAAKLAAGTGPYGNTNLNLNQHPGLGELIIKGGLDPEVDIIGFDISQSQANGFLGIKLPPSKPSLTAGATVGVDPPAVFPAGSQQSYTFAVDSATASMRTVTMTLSGANPADFEATVGTQILPISANGTFTTTLPAGETNFSFGLIDTSPDDGSSDIATGGTIQLTAAIPDPTNPGGSAIQSTPLAITYNARTADTSTPPPATNSLTGTPQTNVFIYYTDSAGGTVTVGGNSNPVTVYQGDGANDIISAGSTPNQILAQNSGSDSITGGSGVNYIIGGAGNDVIGLAGSHDFVSLGNGFNTVNGGTGHDTVHANGGSSIIKGNNGTDLIFGGNGTNEIYAGAQTSLATALTQSRSATATHAQGDLIAVLDGNNTIVGGNGDDLITAGSGNDVIVMGPGNDTFAGGLESTDAQTNWSASTSVTGSAGGLLLDNVVFTNESYSDPYAQPYNGNGSTASPFGAANDTIFGSTGNEVFALGNGNNYVQAGSGNTTVFGGMGNDTVIAGSGNDLVTGGGGTGYVYGGSGADTIYGGNGDNTIIGGSGNSLIRADAGGLNGTYTGATAENNYVTGGSGSDLIYGSSGSDTLIGGTGNVTIYGGSGTESIDGGTGNDLLIAGVGNATVEAGGSGVDTLVGGTSATGTYALYGGSGADSIIGGSGSEALYAGDGGTAAAATSVFGSSSDATANTTIYGGLGVDFLKGGVGSTLIYAGDGGTSSAATTVMADVGNSTLYGGLGVDYIQGGSGVDVLYAGDGGTSLAQTTVAAGSGVSTLYGGAGSSLLEDLTSGQDLIVGGAADISVIATGNDTVVAGQGNSLIQNNGGTQTLDLNAGFGNDTVSFNGGSSENLAFGTGLAPTDFTMGVTFDGSGNSYLQLVGDGGSTTIEDGLTGGLGTISFSDSGSISEGTLLADALGSDTTIADGNNILHLSLSSGQTVTAGLYNDTIASFGANATLQGGSNHVGDLIYSAGAAAKISSGTGGDSVHAAGSNASVFGSSGDQITVTGSAGTVNAGSGNESITASGASDTLIGGAGNATFFVNNSSTTIQASVGGGNDTVISSVSYTAPTNVNALTLTGNSNIVGTANAASDTLTGGAGNDTLVAGSAVDTLIGGTGNSTFVVNNVADVVQDTSTTTNNAIQSSVTYTLPTNVNSLTLTGTANLSGTANSGNDTLTSNSGVDTLVGGSGNDTFVVNNASDVVQDSSATASNAIQSSVSYVLPTNVNTLVLTGAANLTGTANGGNDTLVSNSGIDTLTGGTGDDTFVVSNAADVVQDTSTTASNIVQASVSYTLPTHVNTLTLTGTANLTATGNSANDVITANAGSDTLISGAGVDTLIGGTGNDTFVVNNAADVVQDASNTSSLIQSSVSYTLPTNVNSITLTGTSNLAATANSGNDTLTSNSGVDTLVGGSGNDVFIVSNSSDVIQDSSTTANNAVQSSVSFTLPANVNTLTLTGSGSLSATGNTADDLITGNAGADTLIAGAGWDTLVAGSGLDTFVGGTGNDVFVVNNAADVVSVTGSHGIDTIQSSVSETLPSNVTVLQLTGSANLVGTAVSGNNSLVGNAGSDTLVAGSGHDTLVAGTGPTTLKGGTGPDTFVVNSTSDVIQNIPAVSGNAVVSSINYTLPSQIDQLTLSGTANLVGTANNDANDTLTGNAGNDTLISGTGITVFNGGSGSDTFVVNNASDVVAAASNFNNVIQSSVSYTLPSNVSTLVLTGSANLTGTGSTRADSIVGNAGNDSLIAGVGNDTLVAGTGIDTLIGGFGNDTFIINGTADVIQDTVTGQNNTLISSVSYTLPTNVTVLALTGSGNIAGTANSANDSLVGGAGSDTLYGGAGIDTLVAGSGLATMVAGAGSTTFVVNNTGDVVQGASAAVQNALITSATFTAPTNVNSLTLTGNGNIVGTGNAASDTLVGGAGSDTLVAGSAVDTLVGGTGNTTFVVNNVGDVVTDTSTTTSNAIQSSVSYTLPTNVNSLTLTGSSNLTGTANSGNDTLASNSGVDTLVGGSGNDTFVVGNSADVVQDSSTTANNAVQSSVNYALSTNVNTLVLTGASNLTGTANSGNDTLISNSGVDTLIGGSGNDTFVVNNAADVVQDTSATASNVIQSAVSFTLPTDVNTLTLTGTADLTATGNSANDVVAANSGNDTLISGTGVDTLVGGAGNDTFVVNNSADVVQDTVAGASNALQSSVSYLLPTNVNSLTLTGTANLTATANNGNDTLVSNAGVDTLIGGSGNDLFIVNNSADVLQNVSANDTIQSSVSYTLSGGATNLVLLGSGNISGTGNSAADTLTAGSGNDSLIAAGGLATMIGGAGNDTFVVNNTSDVVLDAYGSSANTIQSSASYTLPGNVDTLSLTGSANLTGTGNTDLTNVLSANSGNDLLIASAYQNTINGGAGSDTIDAGGSFNVIYAGSGGTTSAPTYVHGDAGGTSVLTTSTIYGGSGVDVLYGGEGADLITTGTGTSTIYGGTGYETLNGGSGTNSIYGGSGTDLIYGGSGTNLVQAGTGSSVIYAGNGGTSGAPAQIKAGLGTTETSTIYGGSGYDQITGGQGSDLIVAAAGHDSISTIGGADTIYGAAGALISDGNGGHDLLTAGAGAETMSGSGSDTLVGGTGSDLLYAASGNGSSLQYVINSGFGQDTIGLTTTQQDHINFGTGISPSSLSVNASTTGSSGNQSDVSLILSSGTGSILIDGGMQAGTVATMNFADSGSETLTQLMRARGPASVLFNFHGANDILSGQDAQTITTDSTDAAVYAFGNGDVLTSSIPGATQTIFAYGDNDTITAATLSAAGNSNNINLVLDGSATVLGGNDTVSVNSGGNVEVHQGSTVVQVANTQNTVTVDSFVNYTLPTNVSSLTLDSAVGGISATSNAQGGGLVAAGNADTLTGGAGTDFLHAEGANDVLVGGSGTETYEIDNSTDSIVFGTAAASQTTVIAEANYTLGGGANNLVVAGSGVAGTGNSANDYLSATAAVRGGVGYEGNDTLIAGSGNDTLESDQSGYTSLVGGSGNDTFILHGTGNVVVDNSTTSNNTIISDQSFTLPTNINTLIFSGPNQTGTANNGNDLIEDQGGYGDTLVAGGGNDTLSGGQSADTFVFNSGFGNDQIINDQNGDTIHFGSGITQSSLTFSAVLGAGGAPASLVISHAGGGAVTAVGGLAPGAITSISFADGTSETVPQALGLGRQTLVGSGGNLILSGNNSDSVTGGTGHDTIEAWGNGDTLTGGSGGSVIYGVGSADTISGGTGADSLVAVGAGSTVTGVGGADTLVAVGANSTLIGGVGNEAFVINDGNGSAVVQVAAGAGTDTVYSSVDYTVPTNVTIMTMIGTAGVSAYANSGNDIITANSGGDDLVAGSGADTLIGGAGNDQFVVNSTSDVVIDNYTTGGNDVRSSVSFVLPTNVDSLTLTGSGGLTGTGNNDARNTLQNSTSGNATLIGGAGADSLVAGNSGDDSLVSGSGVDTLVGGYYATAMVINNAQDVIQNLKPSFTISSSVSYHLTAAVNNSVGFTLQWVLTGSGNILASDDDGVNVNITGNAGSDTLVGGTGTNSLNAGTGVDTLIGGGTGSTNYFTVTSASDSVVAHSGETDTLYANSSFTLPSLVDIAYAQASGLALTGNADADTLVAFGGDTLIGGSGADDLMGAYAQHDTLVAGTGTDTLAAYVGDTVLFNSGFGNSEVTVSAGGSGTPLVSFGSGITGSSLTASATLDSAGHAALALSNGSSTITLDGALSSTTYQFSIAGNTGLTLAQFLALVNVTTSSVAGGAGNVILEGTASTALTGGSGSDTIYAAASNDTVTAGTGQQALNAVGANDSIVGGSNTDTLAGYGSNDTLVAGSAIDTLIGGKGATVTFVVNNTGDIVQGQTGAGADSISSSVNFTLPTNVNTLTLTGTSALRGIGNSGNDLMVANSGADTLSAGNGTDTLISGTGIDSLVGGTGTDLFMVNNASDIVTVGGTHGSDTIQSSVNFTASANVANLTLTGTANLSGTGNSIADVIRANSGNDTLTAGSGVATLIGGAGNDTFVVNSTSDVVQDSVTGTNSSISSSVNFTLPTNVNNLTLTGTTALKGTANNATDTLTSNTGIDTLVGGTGSDTFVVKNSSDVVTVSSTAGNDTIQSSVNFVLPSNVQYLSLTGTGAVTGTGNSLTDLITGNTANDTLTGGTGVAVLEGGTAGNDQIKATGNQAALIGGGAADTITGGTFKDFLAAGKVSDSITTGATSNVIAINKGDGATTLAPTASATNVLSLGAGIDTESLTFTKTGNNLILSDGVSGDSITFTNWYSSTSNQVVTKLQVVEIASASYNASGSDALRNKALEEFNFTSLVSQYNTAGSPANWSLSNGMPTAAITSSSTAAYGGDLAYYFGLNGNLTGLNLSAAQSTLTNASFGTATQTIDSWASISGSGSGIHLLSVKNGATDVQDPVAAGSVSSVTSPSTEASAQTNADQGVEPARPVTPITASLTPPSSVPSTESIQNLSQTPDASKATVSTASYVDPSAMRNLQLAAARGGLEVRQSPSMDNIVVRPRFGMLASPRLASTAAMEVSEQWSRMHSQYAAVRSSAAVGISEGDEVHQMLHTDPVVLVASAGDASRELQSGLRSSIVERRYA